MWYEWFRREWTGEAYAYLMEAIFQQHALGKSKFHAVDNHIFNRFRRAKQDTPMVGNLVIQVESRP